MYFVIDPSGNQYGPADFATLAQWVREGRLTASTTVRDATSGQTMMASAIPGLFPNVQSNPYAAPPSYANYPRSGYAGAYDPSSQQDVTTAWILGLIGLLCCAPFAIGGVVVANRALAKGNPNARAPQIVSWVAIALWILMIVIRIALMGANF